MDAAIEPTYPLSEQTQAALVAEGIDPKEVVPLHAFAGAMLRRNMPMPAPEVSVRIVKVPVRDDKTGEYKKDEFEYRPSVKVTADYSAQLGLRA